jgi:hypothetical protein
VVTFALARFPRREITSQRPHCVAGVRGLELPDDDRRLPLNRQSKDLQRFPLRPVRRLDVADGATTAPCGAGPRGTRHLETSTAPSATAGLDGAVGILLVLLIAIWRGWS